MAINSGNITVNVTFKNTESTEPLKNYAQEKIINCLQKFVKQDTEVSVVLGVEKNRHSAEVSFHTAGSDFISKEETNDLYASIDAVVQSLSSQLRKHKEKMQQRH